MELVTSGSLKTALIGVTYLPVVSMKMKPLIGLRNVQPSSASRLDSRNVVPPMTYFCLLWILFMFVPALLSRKLSLLAETGVVSRH